MEAVIINAKSRTILGKKVAGLRQAGELPGVVYGRNQTPRSISIPYNIFERAYRRAGESSIIDLTIDDTPAVKTLIQEVQRHPLTENFTHVDFFEVTMTEKLTASIPLVFFGEAKAVKGLGGTLVKSLDEVTVRCLPGDLIHDIQIDLSALATFEDHITIKDIILPPGIEIMEEGGIIIASVSAPISDEKLKELDEKPVEADLSKVEKVADKTKKEETK